MLAPSPPPSRSRLSSSESANSWFIIGISWPSISLAASPWERELPAPAPAAAPAALLPGKAGFALLAVSLLLGKAGPPRPEDEEEAAAVGAAGFFFLSITRLAGRAGNTGPGAGSGSGSGSGSGTGSGAGAGSGVGEGGSSLLSKGSVTSMAKLLGAFEASGVAAGIGGLPAAALAAAAGGRWGTGAAVLGITVAALVGSGGAGARSL
mmetsp:Transcript_12889/g.32549  ORF Transcript_12889/g.32549 Transcript_12889/m.32549 type:complete len:208 (+) Transcript_12889:819-1442(+)